MRVFKTVRVYSNGQRRVIETGLSLADATLAVNDPEADANTATSPEALERTKKHGYWYDVIEQDTIRDQITGVHDMAALRANRRFY